MQKFSTKLNVTPVKVFNKMSTIPTVKQVDSKTSRVDNDKPYRFYDGNSKSWAADIHPNGTEPSTLVAAIDYNGGDKTLTVTYRSGFKATYHDIEPELAEEFSKADSKGRWALANLWNRSYS